METYFYNVLTVKDENKGFGVFSAHENDVKEVIDQISKEYDVKANDIMVCKA